MKETLEFNHKKQCGLWLILIGIVLIIAVIFGGKFLVNPFVFLIGYYACFFSVNANKKVRERLSQGAISQKQIKMIYFSIYPRVALEANMVGCTDGNSHTFFLVVLYTWLEHGCAGDCMYHYRSNRLCIPRYIGFRYLHCRCSS